MYGKSYEISHSRLIEYRFDKIEDRFINEFNNEKPEWIFGLLSLHFYKFCGI